jgi:putative transposase
MNREVHVRFWESARLRCLAPLAYLHGYDSVPDARASIGRYLDLYNRRRPHSSLDGMTPDQAYYGAHSLPPVRLAA